MSTELEAAELLEKGAEILEQRGWCRLVLQSREGQYCAIGSLIAADKGLPLQLPVDLWEMKSVPSLAMKRLADAVNPCCIPNIPNNAWTRIARWNNQVDRTAGEVIDAMRQTAKDLRNEAKPE